MSRTHWVMIGAVAVGLSVVALGALAGRARSQGGPAEAVRRQAECVTTQPADGGKVYLYVADEASHVLTIVVDGVLAASYQLPTPGAYTLAAGRAEPVDGGQVYCHVVDQAQGVIYTFRDDKYVGTEPLPHAGAQLK